MAQITGVSARFVEALLEGAVARKVDPAPLLRAAGIEPGAARVSAQSYAALMKAVAQALDDEFFGRDSQRLKLGSFAMLCHAVMGCRTLRRARACCSRRCRKGRTRMISFGRPGGARSPT